MHLQLPLLKYCSLYTFGLHNNPRMSGYLWIYLVLQDIL